jgi:hypothetical protein
MTSERAAELRLLMVAYAQEREIEIGPVSLLKARWYQNYQKTYKGS